MVKYLKDDGGVICLEGIRRVVLRPSPSTGGPPYRDSATITYDDGEQHKVSLQLGTRIVDALTGHGFPTGGSERPNVVQSPSVVLKRDGRSLTKDECRKVADAMSAAAAEVLGNADS